MGDAGVERVPEARAPRGSRREGHPLDTRAGKGRLQSGSGVATVLGVAGLGPARRPGKGGRVGVRPLPPAPAGLLLLSVPCSPIPPPASHPDLAADLGADLHGHRLRQARPEPLLPKPARPGASADPRSRRVGPRAGEASADSDPCRSAVRRRQRRSCGRRLRHRCKGAPLLLRWSRHPVFSRAF